jgi:hypothetical protein
MDLKEELVSRLDYDPSSGVISWKNIKENLRRGKEVKAYLTEKGYYRISYKKRTFAVHRIAWRIHYGDWPHDCIDHINMIGIDNRIANLRVCSCAENLRNRGVTSQNKSGVKGVYWEKQTKRWVAQIKKDYIVVYREFFTSLAEAETQVKLHRRIFHGEYARD